MKKKNKNNLSNFLSETKFPCCRVSEKLDVPLLKKKL